MTDVRVRALYEYAGPDYDTAQGTRRFCSRCDSDLGGIYGLNYYGKPGRPEDVLAANEKPRTWGGDPREDREYRHWAYCPWCGAKFEDQWWTRENTIIENERTIDHYRNPGWHAGDQHEFAGRNFVANHWLGVSGGDELCWCQPTAEPGLTGCVIKHNDLDYEAVLAGRRALAELDSDDDDDYDDEPA